MTDLDVMLRWYAPETDAVILHCDECGCEMVSSDGRQRKILCDGCKQERKNYTANTRNRERGLVRFHFDEPAIDLAYAVIQQALEDRDWQRKHNPDNHELSLVDCAAQGFIADGGVELWLAALGIGIRPSMSKAIRNLEA